jgi:hypothetical protein
MNRMSVACCACHVVRANLLNLELCELAIVEMIDKSFRMRCSSSNKGHLFKLNE